MLAASLMLNRSSPFSWAADLLAVFLHTYGLPPQSENPPLTAHRTSLALWTLYVQFGVLLWALFLVSLLMSGLSALRSYLHQTVSNFQRDARCASPTLISRPFKPSGVREQQQGDLLLEPVLGGGSH